MRHNCLPRRLGLACVHGVPLALHEGLVDGGRGRADQLVVVDVHEAGGVRHQEEVRRAGDPLYAGHPRGRKMMKCEPLTTDSII